MILRIEGDYTTANACCNSFMYLLFSMAMSQHLSVMVTSIWQAAIYHVTFPLHV